MRLYGISNCDTVKQARAWLDAEGVRYEWVDWRKTPPSIASLERWSACVGWGTLLNRRGTTWRALDDAERTRVTDAPSALALMRARPTLIRRPVVEIDDDVVVGFDAGEYARRFAR
jgi:arsenate reductase (glutaredoxin)